MTVVIGMAAILPVILGNTNTPAINYNWLVIPVAITSTIDTTYGGW